MRWATVTSGLCLGLAVVSVSGGGVQNPLGFRSDGRCGAKFPNKLGMPGECESVSRNNYCCSSAGWCGSSTSHCKCSTCTDYSKFDFEPPKPPPQVVRPDGRCGANFPAPDAAIGQCNPNYHPCCSPNGWCGDSQLHCDAPDSVDYSNRVCTYTVLPGDSLDRIASRNAEWTGDELRAKNPNLGMLHPGDEINVPCGVVEGNNFDGGGEDFVAPDPGPEESSDDEPATPTPVSTPIPSSYPPPTNLSRGTSWVQRQWSRCSPSQYASIRVQGSGASVTVDKRAAEAFHELHEIMNKYGFSPPAETTGAYNCRKLTGSSQYSLHAYGVAADYWWDKNPYGKRLITNMPSSMVAEILALRTNDNLQVFRWGGDFKFMKDAMHFEIICSPAELAKGIRRN